MNIETYEKVRMWENIMNNTNPISDPLEEVFGTSPDKGIDKKMLKEIEQELHQKGIDVEYVVTNVYPEMKKRMWMHNYCIVREKIEFGSYRYDIYEHDITPTHLRGSYNEVKTAITDIDSWYDYLSSRPSVDDWMKKWEVSK